MHHTAMAPSRCGPSGMLRACWHFMVTGVGIGLGGVVGFGVGVGVGAGGNGNGNGNGVGVGVGVGTGVGAGVGVGAGPGEVGVGVGAGPGEVGLVLGGFVVGLVGTGENGGAPVAVGSRGGMLVSTAVGTVAVSGVATVASVLGFVSPSGVVGVGVFPEKRPSPAPVAATTIAVMLKRAITPAPTRSPLPRRGGSAAWTSGLPPGGP